MEGCRKIDKIPDLDVYMVNVHASKVGADSVRQDYDGVKERHIDLTYCDRTSHDDDEEHEHLIADYAEFCIQLRKII